MKTDLISLVEDDLGPGKNSGRWKLFHCPFHSDHHPSLAVTNGDGSKGPYWRCWSTSCDKHGSLVAWLVTYRQWSKEAALAYIYDDRTPSAEAHKREEYPPSPPDYSPGPLWQKRAWRVIERAHANLWENQTSTSIWNNGKSMKPLDWLHDRGLKDSTLKIWNIGWIPITWQDDPGHWGMDGKPVFIPQGILIPCIINELVWYLKVRQPKQFPKYIQVRKSQKALYMVQTIENNDTVVFCEGEFDALLLWQEIEDLTSDHDLAGVVTLGSAGNPLNVATWGLYLLETKNRLLAYDADEAGQAGSDNMAWLKTRKLDIPKLKPKDKDLTDFYKSGGDLRAWLKSEIDRSKQGEAYAIAS
jgi:hypothetical protein